MPSLLSWEVSLSRVALNHASQNWPRYRRGCYSAGKTSQLRAARDSWGGGSRSVCIATMVSPLVMCTRFPPYRTGTFSLHGQVLESKWIFHTESATDSSKCGVTRD